MNFYSPTPAARKNACITKKVNTITLMILIIKISGKTHEVHTSVAIVVHDKKIIATSSTHVQFKTLEVQEIDSYISSGEADDKAGAYAIQGIAAQFVKNINGSYSGVMGLPLFETVELLKKCGVRPLDHIGH